MFSKFIKWFSKAFVYHPVWKFRIRYASTINRWVIELNEVGGQQGWKSIGEPNQAAYGQVIEVAFENYAAAKQYVLDRGLQHAYEEERTIATPTLKLDVLPAVVEGSMASQLSQSPRPGAALRTLPVARQH